LDAKVKKILRDFRNAQQLEVFVTGNSQCSADSAEQKTYEIRDRPITQRVLEKYFSKSQIATRWLPEDRECTFLLYTSTGKFELETIDLDSSEWRL